MQVQHTKETFNRRIAPAPLFSLWREVDKLGLSTRDIVQNMLDDNSDFSVDDYRFIHEDDIDKILEDELGSDEYMLGCFNAWFLADILDIDLDVIEAMQKAEAFEAIGKLVISMGKLHDLAKGYRNADGYGHHFSSYDGSEEQIGDYYIFRQN